MACLKQALKVFFHCKITSEELNYKNVKIFDMLNAKGRTAMYTELSMVSDHCNPTHMAHHTSIYHTVTLFSIKIVTLVHPGKCASSPVLPYMPSLGLPCVSSPVLEKL